jgi:hypothetical protein
MKHSLAFFFVLLSGCAYPDSERAVASSRPIVGTRVTLRGTAENPKAGAFLGGPEIYVDLPGTQLPPEVIGRSVEVTGMVVERHDLPVFIDDPSGPHLAGIPVPPGTNLHEASRRLILENVNWRTVANGG